MPRWLFPVSCVVVMVVAFSTLALSFPETVGRHFKEDRTFELLTAAAFLAAFALVATRCLRRRPVTRLALIAGAVSLAAFLDEMSFGEREFEFEAPRLFDTKIDALHDFLLPLWAGLQAGHPAAVAITAIGVATAATCLILIQRFGLLREDPEWPLLFGAAVFVAPGLLLDVLFESHEMPLLERSYLEEHLEFSAGILTFLFVRRSLRRVAEDMRLGVIT